MMTEEITGRTFSNKAENIILTVSDDNFAAWLTFRDVPGIIDENEILALLKMAEIKHGFSSAIKYNRLHGITKELNIPFLVARGTDPNANPEINLLFDRNTCFDPHESYNVMEMIRFEKISKGQALAEISEGSATDTGKDVLGNKITGISSVEPDFLAHFGPDIELDEETNTLIALKSGYPYIDDIGKIQIKSDFYINENIVGISMEINGDLVINGLIENSNLVVDGNLTVYGNIKNCMKHGVIASGNIDLDFAENSRIVCKGQIKFHNNVSDCILSASDGIWGDENSNVSGGLLQCSNSISLYNVGSEQPVLTEIEIALATYTKEMLKMTQAKLGYLDHLPSDHQNESTQLANLMLKMEKKYLAEVDDILESPEKRHKISILKSLYPETRVRILNHSHMITEEKGKTIFTLIDNDMVVNEVDRFV
ncbi:MAG: FapA family protein [Candidatus Cloacimonadales bacterium]|nr:FapA family protein [Candidatus Cloacimonadales bacterium]